MSSGHYLIRLFSGGINNWLDDSPTIEVLAKVFKLDDGEQSVYEVVNGEEECLAVAAHKLADPKRRPEAVSVLRIDRGDLSRFGIAVNESQCGTTGIPRWDWRHRNLLADRAQLMDLVRFLAGKCYRGHDQVRRIEKNLVVRTLKTFCGYSRCDCPDHVKQIAQWCHTQGAQPDFTLHQIQQEMEAVQFEDQAIRPGAERLSSGDQLGDWYVSLKEVRLSYTEHYIGAVGKRFGLGSTRAPIIPR